MYNSESPIEQQPINGQPSGLKVAKKTTKKKVIIWVLSVILVLIVGFLVGSIVWYNVQLSPVNDNKQQIQFTILEATSPDQIATQLEKLAIIRSATAFNLSARLSGSSNNLKAGTYCIASSETTTQIIEHLVKGDVCPHLSIMFYPGATLVDNTNASKKYDVTTALKKAGFTDMEIATAFKKTYDSPLFVDKSVGTDLEGYIYGETYNYVQGSKVEDILNIAFAEFNRVVVENNLIEKFAAQGLNLYEGITLASIVQREASGSDDQKQIAQVFYSRLEKGMALGSDVTYQYVADKEGIPRDTNLDSPYNTRRYVGLPPGPIAVPGLTALQAVANPAEGNYLYFLSGDDDITYFARNNAEHEFNIVNHCKIKCSVL